MKAQWPLYQATPMVVTSANGRFIKAAALSSYPNGHSPQWPFYQGRRPPMVILSRTAQWLLYQPAQWPLYQDSRASPP